MSTARFRFFRPARADVQLREHWLEALARTGLLSRGIVYGLVGLLAMRTALTAAQSASGADALRMILQAPLGRILLALIALGLLAYSLWRLAQGWFDTENKGDGVIGIVIRIGFAIAGLANLAIALAAGIIAWGGAATGESDGWDRQQAAQTVLSFPGGWIVIVGLGIVFIGIAIGHFVMAYKAMFMKDFEYTEMSQWERDWVKPIGQAGLTARGVVFALIGLFAVIAGWQQASGKVKGLGEAFTILASQPFGQFLLMAVALGFIAYGIFSIACARYRHIPKI